MAKPITKMNKEELLCYLKENPDKYKSLYTKKCICKINWDYVPEEIITENKSMLETLNWDYISIISGASECFIAKHKDLVNWYYISKHQKLSEVFITEHKDLVDWHRISVYQKLSERFIEKHKDLVDWEYISEYQKLSEGFITKNKDLVDWVNVSICQKLSGKFLAKHKNLVNWLYVSKYQKLSENFITKHKDLVYWEEISKYQKLSKSFISKYNNFLNMPFVNDNWLNKSTEFKKETVVNTGLYKCYEDYFIAYKGIRSDRYSNFNFQYKYMPGETYECFSDGSDNEASFGLSVWTKEEATEYCNELVVKCKIYYEDVTRVVLDDDKIRCSKITILS